MSKNPDIQPGSAQGAEDELFVPEEVTKHQERVEETRRGGYFLFEKKEPTPDIPNPKSIIYFLGSRENLEGKSEDFMVDFDTDIQSEDEMREILKKTDVTPLFREVFTTIIEARNQDQLLLLQSVPGTGKTYSFLLFDKLMHGKDSRCEPLTCTPRTDELDIVGHWGPAGKPEKTGRKETREKLSENKEWLEYRELYLDRVNKLTLERDVLGEKEFQDRMADLDAEFMEKQKTILGIGDEKPSGWTFHKGALLRAFVNKQEEPNGKGKTVFFDEVDNLDERFQNIFLQLSGTNAKLADAITTYSDSGNVSYERGENTIVFFAANYPEFATGKRPISVPLADRCRYVSISPEKSAKDEEEQIKDHSFESLKELFPEADEATVENLRFVLARTLATLHKEFKKFYVSHKNKGIVDTLGQSESREQDKTYSQRTIRMMEGYFLDNLKSELGLKTGEKGKRQSKIRNYVDPETGKLDASKLFLASFQSFYLDFLASDKLKRDFKRSQLFPIVYAGGKNLEQGSEGEWEVKETPTTEATPFLYMEKNGIFEPAQPAKRGESIKTLNLEQVLNTLISRVVRSEEHKKNLKIEGQKALEGQIGTFVNLSDQIISNESVPLSVRENIKRLEEKAKKKLQNA